MGSKKISNIILLSLMLRGVDVFAITPPTNIAPNPGALLNKQIDDLKLLETKREIKKEGEVSREEIKKTQDKKLDENRGQNIKFQLNKIEYINKSEILTDEELNNITSKYMGKTISVGDVYSIINQINDLYLDKGYIVAKAGLPHQTIEGGVVKILLIEGRTGEIKVEGNKTTKADYIKRRIKLVKDKVSNFVELNKSLAWFNGTNDILARIKMVAGKKERTTDYTIEVAEPKKHQFSIISDNTGSRTSGEYRGGINYTNPSVLGYRDRMSAALLGSEGTISGLVSYSIPINTYGTRLGMDISGNTVEVVKGQLKDSDVKGDSQKYSLNLTHPLYVSLKHKLEGKLDVSFQNSKTDIGDSPWIEDEILNYSLSFNMTSYFKNSVLYQSHSYTQGSWTDIKDRDKDYGRYNFTGIYQHRLPKRNMITARVNYQHSFDDFISSSDQIFIGGANSIRGFEESYMGADSGVSGSLEWEFPIYKDLRGFIFVDGGYLYGETAYEDNSLISSGGGLKLNLGNGFYSQVSIGVPFKKKYNEIEVDNYRVNYMISYSF